MKKLYKNILMMTPLVLAYGCGVNLAVNSPPPAEAPKTQIVQQLRAQYPNLEGRVAQGLLGLQSKYPGIVYGLPRHLLEDLGDEPVMALQELLRAEEARYPGILARVVELRQEVGPGRASREFLLKHYPNLRSELLATVSLLHIPETAQSAVRQADPELRSQVLLELSKLVDETEPGLPLEVLNSGQRPLQWLRKNRPAFLSKARDRILATHEKRIRQAAIAALKALENDASCHPGPQASKALALIQSKYPNLLSELVDVRMAARQKMRARIQQEFPEVIPIALEVLSHHPQLLEKAKASVNQHYPNLREDVKSALDNQMPGFSGQLQKLSGGMTFRPE